MRPSLIRSYLLISLGITLLFLLLGALALNLTRHENNHRFDQQHPPFLAKLLEQSGPNERRKILDEINGPQFFADVWFLNDVGAITQANNQRPLTFLFDNARLPTNVYQETMVESRDFPAPPSMVVKMGGAFASYGVFRPRPPPHGAGPMLLFPIIIFLTAIILASAVSASILFLYLKKTSELADRVLNNLKSGDLKSRFPIKRMNEVGRLMNRFNVMADEIEKLFEKLQVKERARLRVLQELAHDLRTPLASLYNVLATMSTDLDAIPDVTKKEMIGLSLRETSYLGKLVEDLLLLSQISEPLSGPSKMSPHDLVEIVDEELEKLISGLAGAEKQVNVTNELAPETGQVMEVTCDQQLMRRLFRNVLDNAFAFAKSAVNVKFEEDFKCFFIRITNDGSGLSENVLQNYGERRMTRLIDSNVDGRISVGLGSVIVKTIAQIHGIDVKISNVLNAAGEATGVQVLLIILKPHVTK